ncbi:unnamed protein product [Aphanomyces euteiches]
MEHHISVPAEYREMDDGAKHSAIHATEPLTPDNDTSQQSQFDQVAPPPPAATPAKKVRVVCLDVFRGITIFTMIFVNFGGGGLTAFNHVAWNGLEPADCVFPCFAWIMGVTMNIGMASHAKKGTAPWKILLDSFIRSIKLFLLGLVVNNFRNLKTGRITGVLQSFGFAFFMTNVAIVAGLYVKSDARPWLHRVMEGAVIGALVLVNLLITFCLPVPGCPTGYLGNEIDGCTGGAHYYVDQHIFGDDHLYIPGSNDPEGFLNWFMVTFIAYIGYVVGGFFLNAKTWKHKVVFLTCSGAVLMLIGLGLAGFKVEGGPIPLNKNLWSLSFVLTVSGIANLLSCLMYVIVDKYSVWRGTPFKEAGMNAIVLYVGHELLGQHAPFGWDRDEDSKTQNILSNLGGAIWYVLLHPAPFTLHCSWLLIAMWLHSKKIFITV